jgi:hypothetical protein
MTMPSPWRQAERVPAALTAAGSETTVTDLPFMPKLDR